MPTRDNHSTQIVLDALALVTIGSNTTTNGVIIDSADFDMGIKFAFQVTSFTDGVFTISYEEGEDSGLSDATAVTSDKIIGAALAPAAATAVANWPSNGLHSTKRFVRAVITSTGVTTGADVQAVAVESGEYNPQT